MRGRSCVLDAPHAQPVPPHALGRETPQHRVDHRVGMEHLRSRRHVRREVALGVRPSREGRELPIAALRRARRGRLAQQRLGHERHRALRGRTQEARHLLPAAAGRRVAAAELGHADVAARQDRHERGRLRRERRQLSVVPTGQVDRSGLKLIDGRRVHADLLRSAARRRTATAAPADRCPPRARPPARPGPPAAAPARRDAS
jgi:hypothetical protein